MSERRAGERARRDTAQLSSRNFRYLRLPIAEKRGVAIFAALKSHIRA